MIRESCNDFVFDWNVKCLAITLMRFLITLVLLVEFVSGFDFSKLLNRIHQATIHFDEQSEEVANKEDNELRSIEAKEHEVDRQVEEISQKYHLPISDISSSSLLEKGKRMRFHRVTPRIDEFDTDAKILRQTELNREKAEKHFLDVEKEISELPEKLIKQQAKDRLQGPSDEDSTDDSTQDD